MDKIIGFFKDALVSLLALFGIAVDEEFASNLESMFGGLKDYKPETEKDSIKL